MLFTGTTRVKFDRIEYRLTGTPLKGELPQGWHKLKYTRTKKRFSMSLKIPAGGWYKADFRAFKEDRITAKAQVKRFGVGEVFVGAGQSNSTNCGEVQQLVTTGMVAAFSGDKWKLANDPQPGCHDKSRRGSFWPAFGDEMYRKDLFPWMMTRINQLGVRGFRAVLWHQGETDARRSTNFYYSSMKKIILESNKQAGWKFPWFVAQVSYLNPKNASFPAIRRAQANLWKDGIALQGPDTDALAGKNRDKDGKGIHFSAKGLQAHGKAWAEKVGVYLDKILK